MAERLKTDSDTSRAADAEAAVPAPTRSTKGYSADPGPERPVPQEGPVPLVPDSEVHGHVKKPGDGPLPPTGRAEPKGYSPDDRLTGAGG